jgi:hypothetical protein
MAFPTTSQEVLQFAANKTVVEQANKFAVQAAWRVLATDAQELAVWGNVRAGYGGMVSVQIDLNHYPIGTCSCTSKVQPCKHVLGLALLWVHSPQAFTVGAMPEAIEKWLQNQSIAPAKPAKPVNRKEQGKRAAKRQTAILNGLDELDRWMQDLIRLGLASTQAKPADFFKAPAKRLHDAQASTLAYRIEALYGITRSGTGWEERMLAELGQIYLLIEAFRQFEKLTAAMQADVRSAVGWPLQSNELDDEPTVSDDWLVIGQSQSAQRNLNVQRIWLYGAQTQRFAMLLEFAHSSKQFTYHYAIDDLLTADAVYYPSGYPLRIQFRSEPASSIQPITTVGAPDLSSAIAAYRAAKLKNRWLGVYPMLLDEVKVGKMGRSWYIVDASQQAIALNNETVGGWELLAVSGGYAMQLFGEWSEGGFMPLSIFHNGQWIKL